MGTEGGTYWREGEEWKLFMELMLESRESRKNGRGR